MKPLLFLLLLSSFLLPRTSTAQLSAKEIIQKMDENAFGGRLHSSMTMTISRPKWSRTMSLKSWADGQDYSLILVTAPAREKGISYLKRKREMWNFQPSIDRTVKMPPSMMTQSWMGSDFKNDDLVRQSSIVDDFTHKLLGKEAIDGRDCYKIQLVPKEDAPVVWGRILIWVDQAHFIQVKTEHYDEDDELVDTIYGKEIRNMGGRMLASKMVLVPADKPKHQTIMEYNNISFEVDLDDQFFSIQNMKRVR